MRNLFEKYLILKYIVGSYVKSLAISIVIFATVFAIIVFSGVYFQIESALNLKYNSPFVIFPLFGFITLSVLCVLIGFLMYFYKYKRPKSKSVFRKTFSNILKEEQANEGKTKLPGCE